LSCLFSYLSDDVRDAGYFRKDRARCTFGTSSRERKCH